MRANSWQFKMKLKQKGKQAMMKRNEEGHEKGRGWRIFQHKLID